MHCGIVVVMFLFRTHTELHPLLNCSPMLKHVPARHFLVECWTWPLRAAIDHVCFLQFPSSAWVHFARISLADEHRLCNSLLYASHSTHVPSLYSRRMYANAPRRRARGLAALSLGWRGVALRIPRQCVVISGHSCQTAPLVGPFSPRTLADMLTCTHSLPSAHLHKVNLFTVIFGEWFAIIGCADEGQSLWGVVSVFGDLILFQTLCLQLRKANVIPKPQKWKFVWTY